MCIRIYGNANIIGKQSICFIESRNIRLHTNGIPVHSCQQMIHRRIRCNTHAIDVHRIESTGTAHLLNHWINGFFYNRFLKFLTSTRFHRFNDTVNYICTITNLSISGRRFSKNLPGLHIDQQCRYCRGSNINCETADHHWFLFFVYIIYKNILFGSSNHALYIKITFPKYH